MKDSERSPCGDRGQRSPTSRSRSSSRGGTTSQPTKHEKPSGWQAFGEKLAERQSQSASARLTDRLHSHTNQRTRAQSTSRPLSTEHVKAAREQVKGWKSEQVSQATRDKYAALNERRERAGKTPEAMAGTPAAFRSYRAATVHDARTEIKAALTERDKAARANDSAAKTQAEARIKSAMLTLERYPPGTGDPRKDSERPSRYHGAEKSARSNGKRDAQASRPADWRDKLWQEVSPRDRDAVAVLALSGVRPAELEKGVRVQHTNAGLTFTIKGAKLGDDRGQQERTITVSKAEAEKSAEGRHLLCIRDSSTREVKIGNGNALTQRIERAGERAEIEGAKVSAYDYRHAFASRLKDDTTLSPADRAVALGQQVERSAEAYGSRGGADSAGGSRISFASASSSTRSGR